MHDRLARGSSRQSGVVLVVALLLLLILSMIGVTVARMQTVEERMARNENSRQFAQQAAEAALRSGEDTLLSVNTTLFYNNSQGYYFMRNDGTLPVSQLPTLNWAIPANVASYTALNGPALTSPGIPAAVQNPNIVMEELPAVSAKGEAETSDPSAPPNMFRVTVQAANADGTPSVMLQSIFHIF
jgi:type IV pilus assembly protein PilX